MKKILLTAGILMCMLLTACKGKDTVKEDTTEQKEVILYHENGIRIELQASISLETSGKYYVLRVINENEEERILNLGGFVANDSLVIGEDLYFDLEPLEDDAQVLTKLGEDLFWEGEGLRSLTCQMELEDDDYETIDERELTIELEEELVHNVLFNTYLGARAEEQVLIDDENVKVTLVGWGRSPDDDYYVRGLFCFENKSDETIPVQVNAISINGLFLDCSDRVDFLKPGQSCYVVSSLLGPDFKNEGLEYISELQFMILTDESQNTGTVNYSGGLWYPVELAEKVDASTDFETGEVLMDAEGIEISLVSQELNEWTSGGGYYKWKLAVVNDSDENIDVAVINVFLDDIPENEWGDGNVNNAFYSAESDVGAHSKRYVELSLSFDELIPQPELRFQFQIRSMAGGAVIYTDDQEITITPDAQ